MTLLANLYQICFLCYHAVVLHFNFLLSITQRAVYLCNKKDKKGEPLQKVHTHKKKKEKKEAQLTTHSRKKPETLL